MFKLCVLMMLGFSFVFCALSKDVQAHGGEPVPRDILIFDKQHWLLKTNFGLIRSQAPSQFICEESFLGGDDFLVQALGVDRWVIATNAQIMRTDDGCSFTPGMSLSGIPKALELSPSKQVLVLLTNDKTLQSPLWTSSASQKFEPFELEVSKVFWTGAKFLDEHRLFLSGYVSEGEQKGDGRFFVVDLSKGSSHEIKSPRTLRYPYVFDGASGYVAGIATDAESGDLKLFYDRPEQFAAQLVPLEIWPTDIVLSENGLSIWIARSGAFSGARYGRRSTDQGIEWTTVLNDYQLFCVDVVDDVVLACAERDEVNADLISATSDKPQALVHFKSLTGVRRDCPKTSDVGRTCPLVWKELAKQLRIPIEEMDMGLVDMSDDQSGDMTATKPEERDGCQSTHGSGHQPFIWMFLLLFGYSRRHFRV